MGLHLISDELGVEVHLTDGVLHFIDNYRQHLGASKSEACGIIIGELRTSSLRVIDISPPADDDERTVNSFHRKSNSHQNYLNQLHEISNGILQYIGEWHTHPEPKPTPSPRDYSGWSKLMKNENFNQHPKLLWIAGNTVLENDWFKLIVDKKYYALRVCEGVVI